MTPHDAEKLLGGYATGNLTPGERRRLFEAALEDQSLFDALAEEEKLRELLSDPAARRRLARALEPAAPLPWFRRPFAWNLAGSLAAMLVITAVLWRSAVPPSLPPPAAVATLHRAPPPLVSPPEPLAEAAPVRRRAPAAAAPKAAEPGEAPPAVARSIPPAAQIVELDSRERSGVVGGVIGGAPGSAALLAPAGRRLPALAYRLERTAAGFRVVLIPAADGEIQVRRRDREGIWRPLLPAGSRVQSGVPFPLPGEFPAGTRLEADFYTGGSPVTIPITF